MTHFRLLHQFLFHLPDLIASINKITVFNWIFSHTAMHYCDNIWHWRNYQFVASSKIDTTPNYLFKPASITVPPPVCPQIIALSAAKEARKE